MPFWRPFRPLQSAPSPKSMHLQEPREQSLGKLGTDTREKEVFCCSGSLQSSGQATFKLDRKHRRFPWLPKNTYQQLPVTAGQIPVSSTNSAFLLSPVKNRGVGGRGKILFLLQCTPEQHPTSPPTTDPQQSLQILEIAT